MFSDIYYEISKWYRVSIALNLRAIRIFYFDQITTMLINDKLRFNKNFHFFNI